MTASRTARVGAIALAAVVLTAGPLCAQSKPATPPGKPATNVNIVSPLPLPVVGTFAGTVSGEVAVTNGTGNPVPVTVINVAWTKNVDEPGLAPFTYTFLVSQTACNCTNCCFVTTQPVPAGKRLVIKQVSGSVAVTAGASLGPITLRQVAGGSTFTTIATIPAVFRTQWNGGDYPAYEFNEEVLAYVDADNVLQFRIFTGGSWDLRSGEVTINGYLVSLP